MLFTLYYMASTWLQAWRLSSLRSRLSKCLQDNYSIVLYKMSDDTLDDQGM